MALSEEDAKEVGSIIATALKGDDLANAINGAVRKIAPGIVKSEIAPISKTLDTNSGDLVKIRDSIAALPKNLPKKGKEGEGDTEEMKTLRKELEEVQARDKARERETEDARSQAAETTRRSAFMTLAGKHMRSGEIAYGHLKDHIETNDDGAYVVEVQRDGYKEKIPLDQYMVKEFLPSDDGSMFVPAKGAGGTGGRGAEGDRSGSRQSGGDAEGEVEDLLDQAGWGS